MRFWFLFAVATAVWNDSEPPCERYCSGRTGADAGWPRRLHAAHIMDSDPDGLYAKYGLRSGAPLQMLWGRMAASNKVDDDDVAIFAYLRDNPCLYRRCVRHHPACWCVL